ncbi:MAG: hypothetical protein J2P15_08555 [Micromonosporaceae bacterium]|nr:hypothetical protein [Micromonosporaceae bacterium]
MATWNNLVDYVSSRYQATEERPGCIKLVFELPDLRSQVVFVWQQMLRDGTEEWLQIESPIGRVDSMNLRAVLEEVGEMVCGGAALMDGVLFVRQAMPMANLDINEFERPLRLVTSSADLLERKFVGGDEF